MQYQNTSQNTSEESKQGQGRNAVTKFFVPIPWVTLFVLGMIIVIEILAYTTDNRESYLKALALSSDRWYTVSTYWVIHSSPYHAWGNVLQWLIASPFAERRLTSKRFALICVVTTLALGTVVLSIKGSELTGERTASGASVVGWMAFIVAAAILFITLTQHRIIAISGIIFTYLFMATGAPELERGMPNPLISIIGHIAGATVGFIISIVLLWKAEYQPCKRRDWKWVIAFVLIASLALTGIGLGYTLIMETF